jgi:hypothetical protein
MQSDWPLLARSWPTVSEKKKSAKPHAGKLKIDLPFEDALRTALEVHPDQPSRQAQHRRGGRSRRQPAESSDQA